MDNEANSEQTGNLGRGALRESAGSGFIRKRLTPVAAEALLLLRRLVANDAPR